MTKGLNKHDIESIQTLNGLQLSMLYQSRSDPKGGHYIEQLAFEFKAFNAAAMQSAIKLLLQRHRALRSLFIWREQDEPKLLALRHTQLNLEWSTETSLSRLLAIDRKRGIKLDSAPLMRVTVSDLGKGHALCVWTLHHAAVDGWSIVILQNELLSLYRAYLHNSPPPETPHEPAWPSNSKAPSAYWQQILKTPPANSFLNAIPTPIESGPAYAETSQSFNSETTALIQLWCRRQKITFASFAHGLWALLLAHISGKDDILFGSIDSGRGQQENNETAVGMFMRLKPIRLNIDDSELLQIFLQNYQREQWGLALDNPPSPAELTQLLHRAPGASLFDTVLIVQNAPVPEKFDDIDLLMVTGYEQTEAPLTVSIGVGQSIQVLFRYQADNLNTETLKNLMTVFLQLMHSVAQTDAQKSIGETLDNFSDSTGDMLGSQQQAQKKYHCITQFIDRVQEQPDSVALIDGHSVSYRELSILAESIRQQLIEYRVGSNDVVGVHLSRSKQCVAAMLAVMSLDACYLPLDPLYPSSHLRFMVEDSGALLVLSNSNTGFTTPVLEIASPVGDLLLAFSNPLLSNSMCLIYTSGSTGKPKGVFLQHTAVANRLQWMADQYPYTTDDVCCHRTPISFVDSISEIFAPLCAGVPAVIINDALLSQLNHLIEQLQKTSVSRLTLVPSLLDAILDVLIESETSLPDLRLCIVSGEALSGTLTNKFARNLPSCKLLNLYGSTEVTADALAYEVSVLPNTLSLEPIGSPITNTTARVCNSNGRVLPHGIRGELVIGGIAVAAGYHRRQELTANKFCNSLFKTGDLAYIDANHIVHYQGRTDRQIKIRGQRVEPSAIEILLLQLEGLEKAVVLERNSVLVAAYVGIKLNNTVLHDFLAQNFPKYSIPKRFVRVSNIPTLANGKIDYTALLAIIAATSDSQPSQNKIPLYDKQLSLTVANIWQELLPETQVSEQSHFFDSGGDSLLAMKMIARTERALGCRVSLALLVKNPVLINFCTAIINASTDFSRAAIITLRRGDPKHNKALFCIHGDAYNIVPYITDQRPIYWISQWAERIKLTKQPKQKKQESINQLAKRYADLIEQTRPNGSYDLIASCGAAVVTLEVAIILKRSGMPPEKLILMDLPRGELFSSAFQRLNKRENISWFASLYHFAYKRLGGETWSYNRSTRAIENKIDNATPISDIEARHYTDARLYSALAKYEPQIYDGSVELVFSERWRRGVETPAEASTPAFWSEILLNVSGFHFSPVQYHNDLLQGDGAAFAANLVCSDTNKRT